MVLQVQLVQEVFMFFLQCVLKVLVQVWLVGLFIEFIFMLSWLLVILVGVLDRYIDSRILYYGVLCRFSLKVLWLRMVDFWLQVVQMQVFGVLWVICCSLWWQVDWLVVQSILVMICLFSFLNFCLKLCVIFWLQVLLGVIMVILWQFSVQVLVVEKWLLKFFRLIRLKEVVLML